jgi:hypothetical protein
VQSAVERAAGPNQHISRRPGSAERFIGKPAALAIRRSLVRDDNQEVEVAIQSVIAAGLGAEEIDPLWLVSVDETLQDAYEGARLLLGQVRKLTTNSFLKLSAVTHCVAPRAYQVARTPSLRPTRKAQHSEIRYQVINRLGMVR